MSLASGLTDNSGPGAARAEGMAGRRGSSGAAAEEIKTEGPGRLTAENLAALGGGGGQSEHADDIDEMRRKYAI